MKILSHRGLWKSQEERNTFSVLKKSLEEGFGFESDIRDYCGKLVISHDPANAESCPANVVFELLRSFKDQYCFAINVKADGLLPMLADGLKRFELSNYFCFDMSVPQMIEYEQYGLRFFTRQSEYEASPLVLYEKAAGVWIDAFEDYSWITEDILKTYLMEGKEVCLVSPELHKKEHGGFWQKLKKSEIDLTKIILCTDLPKEARAFFREEL